MGNLEEGGIKSKQWVYFELTHGKERFLLVHEQAASLSAGLKHQKTSDRFVVFGQNFGVIGSTIEKNF